MLGAILLLSTVVCALAFSKSSDNRLPSFEQAALAGGRRLELQTPRLRRLRQDAASDATGIATGAVTTSDGDDGSDNDAMEQGSTSGVDAAVATGATTQKRQDADAEVIHDDDGSLDEPEEPKSDDDDDEDDEDSGGEQQNETNSDEADTEDDGGDSDSGTQLNNASTILSSSEDSNASGRGGSSEGPQLTAQQKAARDREFARKEVLIAQEAAASRARTKAFREDVRANGLVSERALVKEHKPALNLHPVRRLFNTSTIEFEFRCAQSATMQMACSMHSRRVRDAVQSSELTSDNTADALPSSLRRSLCAYACMCGILCCDLNHNALCCRYGTEYGVVPVVVTQSQGDWFKPERYTFERFKSLIGDRHVHRTNRRCAPPIA